MIANAQGHNSTEYISQATSLPFGSLQREKFLSCYLGKSVFKPVAEKKKTQINCTLWNAVNNKINAGG